MEPFRSHHPASGPGVQSMPATALSLPGPAERRWSRAPHQRARRLALFAACAGVVGALFGATVRPRPIVVPVAGVPALKRTEDGVLQRWAPGRIRVVLDPSLGRVSPRAADRVVRSFGTWLGAAFELPDVEFVDSGDERPGAHYDGHNTVSYGPITLDGHGRELGITVTFTDPASGEILEADIILNSAHPLSVLDDRAERETPRPSCSGHEENCSQGYDFESVVTHEVGHFFGLGEDRSAHTATMFYCQSRCEVHKRSLEPSDHAPLAKLYATGTVTTSQAAGCGKSSSTSSRWVE